MKRGDVFLAKIQYDKADYPRPCVIVDVSRDTALVCLISSSLDLYNPSFDFLISTEYEEFTYTGLKRKSVIKGYPMPELEFDQFIKKLGYFTGKLAEDFENWLGKE